MAVAILLPFHGTIPSIMRRFIITTTTIRLIPPKNGRNEPG